MTKPQTYSQLFANRNFLYLWISQMLSQVTINLMNFYVITKIYSITHSAIAVSFVWVIGSIPALIFAPLSGAIVDRYSKRNMMIATNILQSLTIFSSLFVFKSPFFLYLVVFMYWFFDQLYLPSQQSSVPAIVPANQLTLANGLFLLTQQASVLLGFGLGGILLSFVKQSGTIILSGLSLLLAAYAVSKLPHDKKAEKKFSFEVDIFKFWDSFKVGYKFVKQNRSVLFPLLAIILSYMFVAILSTMLPSYTANILHMNARLSGLLLIVPGGIGALITSSQMSNLVKIYRKKSIMQTGVLIAGLAHLGLGFLAVFPNFAFLIAPVIASMLGVAVGCIIVPAQTLLQSRTPHNLLGRVYSQLNFLMTLGTTIPLLIAAGITEVFGDAILMLCLGMLLVLSYLFVKYKGDDVMANGFRL